MNEGSTHKAKISVGGGTFEFEGSKDYVEQQIEKVLTLHKNNPVAPPETPAEATSKTRKSPAKKPDSPKKSSKKVSAQPKMLGNLVSKEQISKLREFYNEKRPSSHIETYAVLSYWIKDSLGTTQVHIDEIWTLYKVIGERPPQVLIQTFRDAKSKKGFFEMDSNGKYFLTTIGETFVEHDLPKKEDKK